MTPSPYGRQQSDRDPLGDVLAYVRGPDGRYHTVCVTVMSLDANGRVVELTTFVLRKLFAACGFPPASDA